MRDAGLFFNFRSLDARDNDEVLVLGDRTGLAHDHLVTHTKRVARIMYEEFLGFLDELLVLGMLLVARNFYRSSILHSGLDDRALKGLSCCGGY